jgi:hypothetical protein
MCNILSIAITAPHLVIMNLFSNKGLALAVSLLAMALMGDAFSFASKSTSPHHTAISSSPLRRTLASFGSLCNLLESSWVDSNDKSNDGGIPCANGFSNLINFSRSKFSDTKFHSRNIYGTGSDKKDKRGLHAN